MRVDAHVVYNTFEEGVSLQFHAQILDCEFESYWCPYESGLSLFWGLAGPQGYPGALREKFCSVHVVKKIWSLHKLYSKKKVVRMDNKHRFSAYIC